MVTSKNSGEARSVLFRKHILMWQMLNQVKTSSIPTASMVERVGAASTHHVLWLADEGDSLGDTSSFKRIPKREHEYGRRAEAEVKGRLSRVYMAIARLRSALPARDAPFHS